MELITTTEIQGEYYWIINDGNTIRYWPCDRR